MKFLFSFLLVFLMIANSFISAMPRVSSAKSALKPSEKAWKWADKKLRKMSLDEKIGQLVQRAGGRSNWSPANGAGAGGATAAACGKPDSACRCRVRR